MRWLMKGHVVDRFEVGKHYLCKRLGHLYECKRSGGKFLFENRTGIQEFDSEMDALREFYPGSNAVKSIETDKNNALSIIERLERLERELGLDG